MQGEIIVAEPLNGSFRKEVSCQLPDMSPLQQTYIFLFLTSCTATSAQTCQRLDPNLFPSCIKIGHNQTFTLPSDVDWKAMSDVLQWYRNQTSNCSISQSAPNTVDCALLLPLCREGRKDPLLPCRRVCTEMVIGCSEAIIHYELEYLASMCNILPNVTADSGECFEPPNFTPTKNDTSSLWQCHRRLIPMCGDQGYDYTVVSNKTQSSQLKWFYNKTDFSSLNTSDFSLPPFLETDLKKYPKCASIIKKMYCLQYLPPCFPGQRRQEYGLCKNECHFIKEECPEFFQHHPQDMEVCEEFPNEEKRMEGFCAFKTWPKLTPFFFRKRRYPHSSTKEIKTKPWIIATATIIPVFILIITALVGVFLWKRYDVYLKAYRRKCDDLISIISE